MNDSDDDKKLNPWHLNPWFPLNMENPFYTGWPSAPNMTNNYNMPLSGSVQQSQAIQSRIEKAEHLIEQLQANTRRIEANYSKIAANGKCIGEALQVLDKASYIIEGLAENVLAPPSTEIYDNDAISTEELLQTLSQGHSSKNSDLSKMVTGGLDEILIELFRDLFSFDNQNAHNDKDATENTLLIDDQHANNNKYAIKDILIVLVLITRILAYRVLLPPPNKVLEPFRKSLKLKGYNLPPNASAQEVLQNLRKVLDKLREELTDAAKAVKTEKLPTKNELLEQLQQVKKEDYKTFQSVMKDLKRTSKDDLLDKLRRLKHEDKDAFEALMRDLK